MTFGHGTDEAEAKRMVDLALERGVNFFDTANTYGNSQSEILLGRALKGRREEAVVATKFFNPTGPGPNDSGTSRVHIMKAIESSLRHLQTDYVDVYYVHHVDTQTPVEETLRTLDDLVRQGKVRYIACSNFQAWRLMEALWISETKNLARFVCNQLQYSLVVRDIEQEVIPACELKGLGVVAWSPLAGGFLSGKYKWGERKLAGTRSEEGWGYPERCFAANANETLVELLSLSEQAGHTTAQVALRWVLEQPVIASAIVGARTVKQLEENLGATGWHLEGEILECLNKASQLPVLYPESMEKNMRERRERAVKMSSM
jgi:aryl-alcohol dehydrogenase-like predicted oxidoreductase